MSTFKSSKGKALDYKIGNGSYRGKNVKSGSTK